MLRIKRYIRERKLEKSAYARGFNDAIDILQAQRYREKRVGELWRAARLLDFFSDEGRKY